MRELGEQSQVYSAKTMLRPDYLGDIVVAVNLARKALRAGCDVLFFHQGQEAASLFRSRRTFAYFHEAKYDLVPGPRGRAYGLFLGEPARRSLGIVCNSHFTASRIGAFLDRDDIQVVYPGVRPTLPESNGREDAESYCYYHSRFHPRKNHDFLLEVFSGFPHVLRMTGGTWDRKFKGYQQDLFRRAHNSSNLLIRADVDEQTRRLFMAHAALFLFPARDEPFGLALLEAMAAGKPIIALDSGATREVLGHAGVLCGSSVLDWRGSIEKLLSDPAARRGLSKRSLDQARTFSWTRTAREMIALAESWN